MQLDREGIDDSPSTGVVDLKEHFLSNGLSNVAYNKLSKDIKNGDMNVDILCKCDENELKMISKDYKLSYLQQKAFVEAVKLLPNANASIRNKIKRNNNNNNSNSSNDNNNNNNKAQAHFVFVSPKDQNTLNEMKEVGDKLRQFSNHNKKIKEENVTKISLLCNQLKMYGEKLKQSIDNTVNSLIKNVKFCSNIAFCFFFFVSFSFLCGDSNESCQLNFNLARQFDLKKTAVRCCVYVCVFDCTLSFGL